MTSVPASDLSAQNLVLAIKVDSFTHYADVLMTG